jgi:hypothetical protein
MYYENQHKSNLVESGLTMVFSINLGIKISLNFFGKLYKLYHSSLKI